MVRHGQASFGKTNYDRLSERGVIQSRILGEFLADAGLRPDALYSWKLERQTGTADEVIDCYRKRGLPIPDYTLSHALNEYDSAGVLMSQVPDMLEEDPSFKKDLDRIYTDKRSFQKVFEMSVMRWISGRYDKPGVESWADFSSRVCDGIEDIISEEGRGKNIMLFTSGGPIAALLHKVLELTGENAIRLSWQIVNASVTRFMYNSKRITLAGFNMISHLELQGDKSFITYR
ncbi:MAG: histidine phosphatase family protein [Thermodesulfobacteriota bacterium]|nr:histidine phosphatase family protein [Thermodesulfobacteriota bacterium]